MYAYAMNNPVRWVDPTGRFVGFATSIAARTVVATSRATSTQSSSPGVPLRSSVENLGGSVSWNGRTSTATINIWGRSASFTAGSSGVTFRNDRMYVDPSILAYRIMGGATEKAFIGQHSVARHGNHAGIILMAREGSAFFNNPYFRPERNQLFGGGIQFATLGGGPQGFPNLGNLTADFNRDGDVGIVNRTWPDPNMVRMSITNSQMTDLFVNHMFFMRHSNSSFTYSPLSLIGYNSNAYAYSLLRHSGITPPTSSLNGLFPGWGQLICETAFRRRR